MKVSPDLRSTHNHDGAVVLDIRHGEMFRLNLVGSRILELLAAGGTEAHIVEGIAAEFRISRETVASDVHEFIAHLEKHQLLLQRGS
jgi:hypothetical protein